MVGVGRHAVALYWLPLGAGGSVVRRCGGLYETVAARVARRPRQDLYHSALEVWIGGDRFVLEQTPVPNGDGATRGVVAAGAVGFRAAARLRVFRYEVRWWHDGVISDVQWAVDSPVWLSADARRALGVRDAVAAVPTPVWGRDELRTGEMWNSNSIIAWVLARAGLDPATIRPPAGGRAPGWDAGIQVAARRR